MYLTYFFQLFYTQIKTLYHINTQRQLTHKYNQNKGMNLTVPRMDQKERTAKEILTHRSGE